MNRFSQRTQFRNLFSDNSHRSKEFFFTSTFIFTLLCRWFQNNQIMSCTWVISKDEQLWEAYFRCLQDTAIVCWGTKSRRRDYPVSTDTCALSGWEGSNPCLQTDREAVLIDVCLRKREETHNQRQRPLSRIKHAETKERKAKRETGIGDNNLSWNSHGRWRGMKGKATWTRNEEGMSLGCARRERTAVTTLVGAYNTGASFRKTFPFGRLQQSKGIWSIGMDEGSNGDNLIFYKHVARQKSIIEKREVTDKRSWRS